MEIFAAGSLRPVWPALLAAADLSDTRIHTRFAPAGLLRAAIEAGEPCDLFASADRAHPAALLASGRAINTVPFTANGLCLVARADIVRPDDNWLSLLRRRELRLAVSAAGSDPCGDYTRQLFINLNHKHPGLGVQLRERAQPLTGRADSVEIPAGRLSADWLIDSQRTDLYIGYASYAPRLSTLPHLRVFPLPAALYPRPVYALAVLTRQALPLAEFLVTPTAGALLCDYGFQPL